MMRYRYLDFAVDSDLRFEELEPGNENTRALVLREAIDVRVTADGPGPRGQVRVWADEGEPWLSIRRSGTAFRLEFHDRLFIHYESPRLLWSRGPASAGEDGVRHLLLDHALPLIAAHEGSTVLHAACAIADGHAVLFAGPAGSGKSTLVAHLLASGWRAAADDVAAVRIEGATVLVRPAYAGIRLWPDSRAALRLDMGRAVQDGSDKRRVDSGLLPDRAVPLAGLYLLEADDHAPELRGLTRRDAVIGLLRNAFVLDVDDGVRAETQLDILSAVARRVPVLELRVPRQYTALGAVQALIERELAGAAR